MWHVDVDGLEIFPYMFYGNSFVWKILNLGTDENGLGFLSAVTKSEYKNMYYSYHILLGMLRAKYIYNY